MAGMNGIGGYGGMNGVRGFGGLASGLDRDALIESMTYGTTSKIDKQKQKKMLLQWQQMAVRSITDKMVAFADKYTATMTSSTNLLSGALWGRNNVSVIGEFSKYVSVSGTSKTANDMAILGVKQLAEKAKLSSGSAVSDQTLKTGDINLSELQDVHNLEGKTITFKHGADKYTITLASEYEDEDGNKQKLSYGTAGEAADSINKLLEQQMLNDQKQFQGKKLSDVVTVTATEDGKFTFTSNDSTNGVSLTGGSALEYMGITKDAGYSEDDKEWKIEGSLTSDKDANIITQNDFLTRVAGKNISFTYNGVTKSVKIPGQKEIEEELGLAEGALDNWRGNAAKEKQVMDGITSSVQTQLNDAFGKGRIKVDAVENNGNYRLEFKTMKVGTDEVDNTSTLSISGADAGLLGENGALKTNVGQSNRVNMDAKLSESGIKGVENLFKPGSDKVNITINGKSIEVTKDMTMNELMKTINEDKELGVTVSYQSMSDTFTFTAKGEGAGGNFKIGAMTADLFGITGARTATGKDAIIAVKYGDGSVMEVNRGSNTFDLDGMKVSVSGKFGYDESGNRIEGSEAVTFDAKVNTDKIVETVKKMVEEYNEIIELVNKEATTKPDRDYAPLTDAQKKELSEDEIKTYEEKAKQGLLFGDSDLRGLSSALRNVISAVDQEALRAIGISTSSSYSDNGKLQFDEAKFKQALETDPQKVEELFTKKNGIADNMKATMDKYAKTVGATKGILIEKAGSVKSPLSMTNNSIFKQIGAIDKVIAGLQKRLSAEEDRYIRQFTTLESLISQMNSQSSMLSGFGGGY